MTQPTGAFVHVDVWLWAKVMLRHNGLKAWVDSKRLNTMAVASPEVLFENSVTPSAMQYLHNSAETAFY